MEENMNVQVYSAHLFQMCLITKVSAEIKLVQVICIPITQLISAIYLIPS